ncbi:zf-HC2 domain-containing protein [Actinomadura flavalba]|uniref:zf-HC2 domain-containing protein n=1 Tax=Actinomadura flavalba TaxID=1120938 RepID=UPI0003753E97|nr:zf-HC2 domain-containing protein [Actinomadura flavalba]
MNPPVEHTDVAAYALGVLEPGDRAAFETHLASCARCRDELAALAPAAARLREERDARQDTT